MLPDRLPRGPAGQEACAPKNLRTRPNCCDIADGGPRARPRVFERNGGRIGLSQGKRIALLMSALVLLALTRTSLSRRGDICQEGERGHLTREVSPRRASARTTLRLEQTTPPAPPI